MSSSISRKRSRQPSSSPPSNDVKVFTSIERDDEKPLKRKRPNEIRYQKLVHRAESYHTSENLKKLAINHEDAENGASRMLIKCKS